MNSEKFTEKSIEAINLSQQFATKYQNSTIRIEHLLLALFTQIEGLIPKILEKMNKNINHLVSQTENYLNSLPKVSGGSINMDSSYARVLDYAEKMPMQYALAFLTEVIELKKLPQERQHNTPPKPQSSSAQTTEKKYVSTKRVCK